MADTNAYDVWLVSSGEYKMKGFFTYRGERLPEPGEEITVENSLTGPSVRARVTRVEPENHQRQILATRLDS